MYLFAIGLVDPNRTDVAATNNFTGSLPNSIGAWTSIWNFFAHNNSLTGTLPASMEAWTALAWVDLSDNQFSGTLPEFIGTWPITGFVARSNDFTGTIPESVQNWFENQAPQVYESMEVPNVFDVSDNELTGTIPNSIGNWAFIDVANFHNNALVGIMPSGICDAPNLRNLTADCIEVECSCCTECY